MKLEVGDHKTPPGELPLLLLLSAESADPPLQFLRIPGIFEVLVTTSQKATGQQLYGSKADEATINSTELV
jgi:hypothetical protein